MNAGLNLRNCESLARQAVATFWKDRSEAAERQHEFKIADRGERASVTAGKNMDGFVDLLSHVARANGLADAGILRERSLLALPGFSARPNAGIFCCQGGTADCADRAEKPWRTVFR
jgi:hypothetical protein